MTTYNAGADINMASPPRPTARKVRIGKVVSDKMDKTIVVSVVSRVAHPRFGKIVKQVKKVYAHDEKNEAKVGNYVSVVEIRPLSSLKRWRLLAIRK